MNFEKKRSSRITSRQLETLVAFMEKHPDFSSGKLTPEMNKCARKELWEQLAVQLNYDGWGPIKTADQWRKCWNDQKCNIRSKAAAINRDRKITGGGPPKYEKLTELEERVLSIAGWITVTGDNSIPEGGFPDTGTELIPMDEGQPTNSITCIPPQIHSPETILEDGDNSFISSQTDTPKQTSSGKRKRSKKTSLEDISALFQEQLSKKNELLERLVIAVEKQSEETKKQTQILNDVLKQLQR